MEYEKTVTVAGEEVTVKMTFGLLNEVCRICGDIEGAAVILLDNDLRLAALKTMLSKRDEKGRIVEEIDPENLEISIDDAMDLVDWAGSHATDFFLKAAMKTKKRVDPVRDLVRGLTTT